MKKLLIMVLLTPVFSFAQSNKQLAKIADTINFPNPLEFAFVDSCNLSKHEIYAKCISFFATKYNNSKSATTVNDSTTGQIIMHEVVSNASTEECVYSIVIDIKEKKFRVKFNNYRINRGTIFKNVPIETAEKELGVIFSGVKRQSYWNIQKMKFCNESKETADNLYKYISKEDNF